MNCGDAADSAAMELQAWRLSIHRRRRRRRRLGGLKSVSDIQGKVR